MPRYLAVVGWLLVASALCGCSSSDPESTGEKPIASDAKLFEASFKPDPSDPVVGENRLEMLLQTPDDVAVTGADVDVDGEMPAHGHALGATPTASETGGGHYAIAQIVYTMPGLWQLAVHVKTTEKSDTFSIEYEVH